MPEALSFAPEERPARIGFVGAGHRIRTIYLPILTGLSHGYEIVGFSGSGRSESKAKTFSAETGIAMFADPAALVHAQKPDFLVVAVNDIDHVLPGLLGLGVPLLVETPFSWSLLRGRKSLARIRRAQLLVGVAEQTPYLPAEQLKKKLIDLGVLGRIIAAYNDFAVFDYHGIAALRAYIGREKRADRVNAVDVAHPAGDDGASRETWLLGTVRYKEGCILAHQYSDSYFMSDVRQPKSLRLYGTSGSIVDEKVLLKDPNGKSFVASIVRNMDAGRLISVSVATPIGNVSWQNPFADYAFNDEQIAVATLLQDMKNAVLFGGMPLYDAEQNLADMELLTGMRTSCSRDGSPVTLPIRNQHLMVDVIRSRLRAAASKIAGKGAKLLGRG